ncbi:YdeI/OmpD-associated family protein [Xanthomonas translucens pv. undulosa]|nr:hypothetical protein ATB54_04475 [Xanthomonas translucens]MBC3972790.1 YdeI/OmpD-associated family protein [Xanthomonas translucens pv. undulosa]MQS43455.1 hypothetical protein [Xanthomonas translucens pv. translucens]UKE43607.1 YdeI/OmpD-associated family protein [Xanthomonas translucens pv. secalis]UKE58334.1 YdeI/OmpD-associated family protein [Xanthomonas translucens pv. hordei]
MPACGRREQRTQSVAGLVRCCSAALARRDWIFWIVSGKKADTRVKRIASACDMLASGKRCACCFDRSDMYSKSPGAPQAGE